MEDQRVLAELSPLQTMGQLWGFFALRIVPKLGDICRMCSLLSCQSRETTIFLSIPSQVFALLSTSVLWFIERKQKKENASEESDRLIPDPGSAVRYDSAMVA